MRPFTARWRGWLPPLALALFMFAALLALGGDRGYFYREGGIHNWNTAKTLAIAENLSTEHNFRMATRVWRDEYGGFAYSHYGRFPIGGFALVKLAILPFGDDIAANLLAARILALLAFCGAAALAFLAMSRITASRRIAFIATLLAFSGLYAVYFADEVFTESVIDMFGAALVFHGMAIFVQEGRFRQLVVKTCAALLLGWHVYALLLPFIAIGFGGEAIALWRSSRSSNEKAKAARAAIAALVRSRYIALAAVAILFGSALLAFNLANEYTAYDGDGTVLELPSVQRALKRLGLRGVCVQKCSDLEWGNFIRRQLHRVGAASTPYSLARAVGYDFPTDENIALPRAPALIGAAAVVAALGALALARRYRILAATAVLFGFCWSIPMRHNTYWPDHYFESLPYTFMALALFALALVGARGLLGGRGGERLALAVGAAAALVFAASVFYAGRLERDPAQAARDRAEMADFSAILEMARGSAVAAFPPQDYALDPLRRSAFLRAYFLSGSYWSAGANACDTRGADFAVSAHRYESPDTLTPDNRFVFLYEGLSPAEMCQAERRRLEASEPAARAVFDVYLQDGVLSYLKAPCEPSDYEAPFYLYAHPADANDLPAEHRRNGFLPMDISLGDPEYRAAAFDGMCIFTAALPDYPITAIRTGQWIPGVERLWEAFITPPLDDEARAFYEKTYRAIESSGAPAARSGFDLYLDGDRDTLSYLKEPCGEGDTRGRFFLSVHPADVADLPAARREIGHESLNFTFAPPAGVVFAGKCMATRPLPDYPIARIETGQWIPGGERLWDAAVVVSD